METPGLEGKFDARAGLQVLLAVPEIGKMHGRLQPVNFLQQAIDYASQRSKAAKTSSEVAQVWEGYVKIAEQLLAIEGQRVPIPTSPLDAEPRMWHNPEGGGLYIVVGGWPQEGGYAMNVNSGDPLRW